MATTESSIPINGSYTPQAYDAVASNYAAANANSAAGYGATQQAVAPDFMGPNGAKLVAVNSDDIKAAKPAGGFFGQKNGAPRAATDGFSWNCIVYGLCGN